MDIEPIATALPWKTSAFVSPMEQASSILAGETKPLSPRASLRRFKAETSPPPRLEMRAEFLRLEEEADAAYAKDFQGNGRFDEYHRGEYFRAIAFDYDRAARLALEASSFLDAARLLEKASLVFSEKLNMPNGAIDRLLKAWKLYTENNHSAKAAAAVAKLHLLGDQYVSFCRKELTDGDDLSLARFINALLTKAEIFELTGSPEEAWPFYEEVANLPRRPDLEEPLYRGLHPHLIAGLCFEKLPYAPDKAELAYEQVVASLDELLCELNAQPLHRKDIAFNLLFSFPLHLQLSLASLKCGKLDVFASSLERQIHIWLSLLETADFMVVDVYYRKMVFLPDYLKALVSTSLTILGPDSPYASSIMEAMQAHPFLKDFATEPLSDARKHFESLLLGLYLAPQETSVKELLKPLEQLADI